jgi:anthranilate phosphoribosyltransferase
VAEPAAVPSAPSAIDWAALTAALRAGHDLAPTDAGAAMRAMLAGGFDPAVVEGLLVALHAKGERGGELRAMLEVALAACRRVPIEAGLAARTIDVVGTGGDRSHSVNVSTMTALVVSACGVPVCKHGSRAATSRCGSADVLEALGVPVGVAPEEVARRVAAAGFGFCLATAHHPAFAVVAPVRRRIPTPTVFNLIGPMANPAPVGAMLLGVRAPSLAEPMLEALEVRDMRRTWVVHGDGGLDEASLAGETRIVSREGGVTRAWSVVPEDAGLARATLDAVRGGDPATNAAAVEALCRGERGPVRDIVLLNAAIALQVADAAGDVREGVQVAAAAIDDGRLAAHLARVREPPDAREVRDGRVGAP